MYKDGPFPSWSLLSLLPSSFFFPIPSSMIILLYAILIFAMFTNFLKTHENCRTLLQSACALPAGCQNGRHRSHLVICYSNSCSQTFQKLMETVKPYYNPHARCRLAAKMGGTDLIVLYAIRILEFFTKFF